MIMDTVFDKYTAEIVAVYILKSSGASTLSCGTPHGKWMGCDVASPILMTCVRADRHDSTQLYQSFEAYQLVLWNVSNRSLNSMCCRI